MKEVDIIYPFLFLVMAFSLMMGIIYSSCQRLLEEGSEEFRDTFFLVFVFLSMLGVELLRKLLLGKDVRVLIDSNFDRTLIIGISVIIFLTCIHLFTSIRRNKKA